MAARLVRRLDNIDSNNLADMVYLALFNVEEGLISAGAIPGKDYTYQDLLAAATPIAAQWYAESDNATYER